MAVPWVPVDLDPEVLYLPERPEGLGLCPPAFREVPSLVAWVDRLPAERFDAELERAWDAWTWWRNSPWYKVVPLFPQLPCSPAFRAVDLAAYESTANPLGTDIVRSIHLGFRPRGWDAYVEPVRRNLLGRSSKIAREQSIALREAQRATGAPEQVWYHQETAERKRPRRGRDRDRRGVMSLHGVFRKAKPAHEPWTGRLPPETLVTVQAPRDVPGKRGILFVDRDGNIRYWT